MRFIWISILGGGVMIMIKALELTARHEKIYEDMLGDRNKLPAVTRICIELQRWIGDNSLYILALLVLVAIWICFSKRPRAVRVVVVTLAGALAVQGLFCIAVSTSTTARTGYDFWKETQELQQSAEP